MISSRAVIERYWSVLDRPLDKNALAAAQIALADGLAVMVAAVDLEPAAQPFADHATALGGTGRASIIGTGGKSSAPLAALANGALAHALDFEDTFEAGMIHPNASLVPAVLALAESERAEGGTVLRALALGCDFACRLSLSLDGDPAQKGWYHPPILSGLGATLGAAVIAQLTEQQMLDALGLFAAQFMLSDELKRSPQSHLRAVREGLAARAAVEAVLLARHGVRALDHPLEGQSGVFHLLTGAPPRSGPMLDGLGEQLYGPAVALKRWPCCRGTHSAIMAARALRDKGVAPEAIARVEVVVTPPNDMLFGPGPQASVPRTPIGAKFSIPFVFAQTIKHGTIALNSFSHSHLADPQIIALAGRVKMASLERDAGFDAIYEVSLANGAVHRETIAQVPIWRTADVTLDDLWPKVGDCFRARGRSMSLEAYFAAIARLDQDGVEPLMALL